MTERSDIAFKEWAVVCRALLEGRQTLILRKGGIHEDVFRAEHGVFWLFPTGFHQHADQITPEAGKLFERLQEHRRNGPADGRIRLEGYARLIEAIEVDDFESAQKATGLHIWSSATVEERFHRRQPGLTVMVVRAYRLAEPVVLDDSPKYGGCLSWIPLEKKLPLDGEPVIDEGEFERRCTEIHEVLAR